MGITAVVGDVVAGGLTDAAVGGIADAALTDVAGSVVGDAVAGGLTDAAVGGIADAGVGAAVDAGVGAAGLSSADAAALYGASGYGEAGALTASQTAAATAAGWTPQQIASALSTGGTALSALTNVVGNINKGNAAAKAGSLNAQAAQASGQILSNAAITASQQQQEGIQNAIKVSQQTLQQQTANQMPYINAGNSALTTLSAGLQPGGQFNKAFTMADAQNMDAYKFALQQGQEAITNAAAAGGQSLSTADIQSQAKFAEGTAAQYEQQAFNQWLQQNNLSLSALQNMVQTGQVSTNQLQSALTQAGVSQETLNQNLGNAVAGGTVGSANAQAGAIVGANNANAAGVVGQANANGNALTAAGNGLSSLGSLYGAFNGVTATPANPAGGTSTIQTQPNVNANVLTMPTNAPSTDQTEIAAPAVAMPFTMSGSNITPSSVSGGTATTGVGSNLNKNYTL